MCPIPTLALSSDFSPTPGRTLEEDKKEQRTKLNNASVLGVKKKTRNLIKEPEEKKSKNQGSIKSLKGKADRLSRRK